MLWILILIFLLIYLCSWNFGRWQKLCVPEERFDPGHLPAAIITPLHWPAHSAHFAPKAGLQSLHQKTEILRQLEFAFDKKKYLSQSSIKTISTSWWLHAAGISFRKKIFLFKGAFPTTKIALSVCPSVFWWVKFFSPSDMHSHQSNVWVRALNAHPFYSLACQMDGGHGSHGLSSNGTTDKVKKPEY